jgi:hypothetical protein
MFDMKYDIDMISAQINPILDVGELRMALHSFHDESQEIGQRDP